MGTQGSTLAASAGIMVGGFVKLVGEFVGEFVGESVGELNIEAKKQAGGEERGGGNAPRAWQ